MSIGHQLSRFLWRQKWFKPEYGKSLYKLMCAEGEPPDTPFSKDFFGLRYEGNLRNNIDFNIFYYGAFEKPLLFFLRDTLLQSANGESVFCDVGANIGQHSLFMSLYAKQVHAFEPYQGVSDRLGHQIALNKIQNITLHKVGLSDKVESLTFYAPTGSNQGVGSFDASTTDKGNKPIGELALVDGDSYIADQGIHNIKLMKIDVEGFEKSALAGLSQTLDKDRPIVVCEITYGNDLSFKSLQELESVLPANYEFYTFDTRKADGTKARRRGAKEKRSGKYRIIPFQFDRQKGQDDIIACPRERVSSLPRGY